MNRTDLDAYLGDFAAGITEEQAAQLLAADERIAARWPHPDDRDSRELAMSAATQVILGDDTLANFGAAYSAARIAAADAHASLTGAIIASADRGSERALMAEANVARDTVRKALGK